MSMQHSLSDSVMEGHGAYNKHAALPAEGAALALPLLEKAVRELTLDSDPHPVVIADYGSSQGKNSLAPLKIAINGLRVRTGPDRPISVFHIDQPANDFNSLFEVLHSDPSAYVLGDRQVYVAAVGKSFYENVLPPATVHLGWSSYAAVWLSRVPTPIPDHFIAVRSKEAVCAEFDRQARQDWETFLTLRARELRPGGRLLVVLPGIADNGLVGLEPIFDCANEVLEEMVRDGLMSRKEHLRMAIKAHPRKKRDLLAPFDRGSFQQLNLQDFQMFEAPDGGWAQYNRDGDKDALATKRALFFRSIFVPSLAGALAPTHGVDGSRLAFADQIEQRLKQKLASQLKPLNSFVQVIVLSKKD